MLGWFLDGYLDANIITPAYILVLFIVSVLALAWSIVTLFSYHRSSTNAQFVALIDLCFVGALIAGVYYLRFVGGTNCTSVNPGSPTDISLGMFGYARINYGLPEISVNKTCAMLKASFALGIMNIIFFFITSVLAWLHGDQAARRERRRAYSRHSSRSRHRSHSGHRHHGSPRRSHSHRQVYV